MRFLYLDPALRNDIGHHANYCRYIVGELRARGIETLVFGRRTVAPALQAELGVVPRFRYHTYAQIDPDPFAGWLIGFDDIARRTLDDLRELPPTDASDVVYVSSIRPPQLMALLEWRKDLSPDRRPAMVVESVGTGMTVQREPDRLIATIPNPQVDARATLFRYVAHRLPREPDARFYVVTFGDVPTEMFRKILSYPAHTLPLPYPAVIPLRSRAG
ncbi:MAG TPA: glycosyltransferase family 1 protein, partial [Stellaceae bacterium]|nr:glycosyltransferase family 1 protein [Stellaceae bacterium]